jgi:hypothetical protein
MRVPGAAGLAAFETRVSGKSDLLLNMRKR